MIDNTLKFTKVDLEGEKNIRFGEHETLMSFYDDSGNIAFRDWWEEEGSMLFGKFYDKWLRLRSDSWE